MQYTETTHPVPDPARAWLERCPAARRGTVANWFHSAVRGGARIDVAVLAAVRTTIEQRLHARYPHTWEVSELRELRQRLTTEQADALAYAQHVIHYEALPRDAQLRIKAARAAGYWDAVRYTQPATPKQLNYLAILGHRAAEPLSKAEASDLIDALLHQREDLT